jgi:hypothetical protein
MTANMQIQIDFMVSRFQEAMQKFENTEKVNQAIQKDNQDLKAVIEKLQSRLDTLCVEIENMAKTHINATCSQDEKLKTVTILHQGNISLIDSLRNDLLDVVRDGFDIKDKINDFVPNFVQLKNELEKLGSQIVNAAENSNLLKEPVNFCKQEIEKIYKSLSNKDMSHDLMSSLIKDLTNEFIKHKTEVQSFFQQHLELIQNLDTKLQSAQKNLIKYTDDKVAAIPQPEIPSLDDLKTSLQKQLEPVALDAKNSNIRTVNNESKINVMEKRIEQIFLLLAKHEIQG